MQYSLSDVASYISVKINTGDISVDEYISTENMLSDKGGITRATSLPSTVKTNSFKDGDVLFSNIRTYFRKIWFATFSGGVSNDVLVIRSQNTDILFNKYLYYLLSDEAFIQHTIATAKGTKMPRGDKSAIMNYKFQLPPLPTQKKIAYILSTLDDKIELNRKMNETLEAMAEALFKSWFVDFDPVHAKAACKSEQELEVAAAKLGISKEILELFPSEFEESEMGMIPKGWEECKISDVLEIKYGKDHKKLAEGSIPVYGSGGVMRYADNFLYDKESILIPRKGTLTNLFYIDEPFWTVDTIFWSKINTEKVSGKFLFSFLKTIDLSNLNVGSAVPSLTTKVLNEIKISIPTIDEQRKFNKYADNAWEKMKSNRKQIKTLEVLRDTLFSKLLSGKSDD